MEYRRQRLADIVSLAYLAGGVAVLAGFLLAPPDGLANIWVALYVFPFTIAGLALGLDFPFAGHGLGYYGSHVAYFIPALILCALAIRRLVGGKRKRTETGS